MSRASRTATRSRPGARSGAEHPPWAAAYAPDVDWQTPIATQPLHRILDASRERFAERPCLDFLGKRYSYAEVADLVGRAAEGFRQLGVERGTRVGLCLPNSPYFVICYYAILKAGGTVVNFNPLYVAPEIARQIEDSKTEIMVTLDLRQLYPKIAGALETSPLKRVVICPMSDILPPIKGVLFSIFQRSRIADIPDDLQHVSFDLLTRNQGITAAPETDPGRDMAVLQYTGGTTGRPKGAMLSHGNLSSNIEQLRRWFPEIEEGGERILAILPFFHVFAMTSILNFGIATGAELIVLPRFDLADTLAVIDEKRPTLFPAVPTIYGAINQHPGLDEFDLTSIKYCISGGAPLPVEVKRDFEARTGCNLVEGYGLTEASPVLTCNPLGGKTWGGVAKEGSIGIPLPATRLQARALDNPEKIQGIGEKGEIWAAGPQVMAGYLDRPGETKSALSGGFLRTGDVGYMDEDGYFFLVDRIGDLIICSGYNVYPRQIEDAIHLHPAVAQACVIAIPDDYRGQSPKAFVQLREGADLDAQELLEFLSGRLSPIEMPKAVEFRDTLPVTLVGKLSKKQLALEEADKG